MLRESAERERAPLALRGVIDQVVDVQISAGRQLRDLATALVARTERDIELARTAVVDALGDEAAMTAIGIVSNFQMMNRALDAVGIPATIDPSVAVDLGIDVETFGGAHGAA